MRLYLDVEFNGYKGELISMALVSGDGKTEWYECLHLPDKLDSWVAENVVPFLNKHPLSIEKFVESLTSLLKSIIANKNGCTIISDWPEDFIHLLNLLYERGGKRYDLDFKMSLITSGDLKPFTPHNALSDARALRDWHNEFLKASNSDDDI